MIVFAYDGSLNGDWVANYAIRFAAGDRDRNLRVVHVRDAATSEPPELAARLSRMESEARRVGVSFGADVVLASGRSVAETLVGLVPGDGDALLVAGTRARARKLAYLAGTVTARLLEMASFPVVAMRVVHPGVVGQPGRVLLPLLEASAPGHALPLLARLGPELQQLHVLLLKQIAHVRYRLLGVASAERLLHAARQSALRAEQELRAALVAHRFELDASAAVTDDAPKEILVHAGKLRSRLVCLEASERTLTGRLVYGNPVEEVLRDAPCDIAVYRASR